METYFAFSDDSGDYLNSEARGKYFLARTPYFCNSCFIVAGKDYNSIKNDFLELRNYYDLPDEELKYSYIWIIKNEQERGCKIKEDKEYYPFGNIPWHKLVLFVDGSIELIKKYNGKALYTVTDNSLVDDYTQPGIIKMHIQDIMQRVQMYMQDLYRDNPKLNCQAQLLFDTQGNRKDQVKLNKYRNIIASDRLIADYYRIIDNPVFWVSENSIFLQIADYFAGVFNGFMRGYEESTKTFCSEVYPIIRKDANLNPLGMGICAVPTKRGIGEKVKERLSDCNLLNVGDDILF